MERTMCRVLMGKPEGKKPIGRSRRRWEDWIKRNLREIGWRSVDWIHLALYRDLWRAVVNTVMTFGFWCHGVSPYLKENTTLHQYKDQLVNTV
jgi:hypothetical protein